MGWEWGEGRGGGQAQSGRFAAAFAFFNFSDLLTDAELEVRNKLILRVEHTHVFQML